MFEYDKKKSNSNKIKHGIDFEAGIGLWEDPEKVIINSRYVKEERFLLIGKISKDIWSAIYTLRGETIRIISIRKSREDEKEIYFGSRV